MSKKTAAILFVVVALSVAGEVWSFHRPADPEAWRSFGADLIQDEKVWATYLAALRRQEKEALGLARHICRDIGPSAHGSEEFFDALEPALLAQPAFVLQLLKDNDCSIGIACYGIDRRVLRRALRGVLDGGQHQLAIDCLD